MSVLTLEQLTILKTDYFSDGTLQSAVKNSDGDSVVVEAYNEPTASVVWRTNVRIDELFSVFDWIEMLSLGDAQLRLLTLLGVARTINPGQSNIRIALEKTLGPNSFAAIQPLLKRLATRLEMLLGSGKGTDDDPATLAFDGLLTLDDMDQMRSKG